MELKVQCQCGQKYKFDVEPVNGQMPFTVNCPVCGADGTQTGNAMLAQMAPTVAAAAPAPARAPVPAPASGLRINRAETPPPAVAAPPPVPAPAPPGGRPAPFPRPPGRPMPAAAAQGGNIGLGIVGVILGAAVGAGLMYGFWLGVGFRFPFFGLAVGASTAFGGRILYKGGDNSLGGIAAAVAALAVVSTYYLIYGEFPLVGIISTIISVSIAYRVGSG